MKRSGLYISAAIAALIVSWLLLSPTARFHAKCDSLALGSNLEKRFLIHVPNSELRDFNAELVSYLDYKGFTFETSENVDFLSPPDRNMNQFKYVNIKTIGCSFNNIVWSENARSPNEFIVTVHSTPFSTKGSTKQIITELERELGLR